MFLLGLGLLGPKNKDLLRESDHPSLSQLHQTMYKDCVTSLDDFPIVVEEENILITGTLYFKPL